MTEPEAYHVIGSLSEGCANLSMYDEWKRFSELIWDDGWSSYP